MAWQDELRVLDKALAEGRISADDYRRRRDEVLSGSNSAAPAPPLDQGAANRQYQWTPMPPQAGPPSGPQPVVNPDATQVVTPQTPPQAPVQNVNPDATQVVNTGAGNADSERTQYVAPVQPPTGGWQSTPPQHGAAPPPPWLTGDGFDQNQGWGGGAHGPEVFEEKSSGAGKKVLVVLIVLLVLGGIGTGAYFLINRQGGGGGGGEQTQAQSTPPPTSSTKPKPTDPLEILLEQIPEPGGKKELKIEVAPSARLVELKMLDQGEADLLTAVNITKVPFKSGAKDPDQYGPTPDAFSVMVFPTNSDAEAETLVAKLKAFQETQGLVFIKEPLPNMPPAVIFEKKVDNDAALYRGLWVSGKNVVRVNVDQVPMTGEASLSGSYQRQVQSALKNFPATQ
jgi:hypothetical protein